MQFGIEDKRQVFLRVVFRGQVAFFFWTVRRDAFARVVNPANDVIEVCLFAYTLQVGGKVTTHLVVAFAD